MVRYLLQILAVLVVVIYFSSCEDEKYLNSPDAQLEFSADTIMFDTIFTNIGSTTRHFKVYNPYNQDPAVISTENNSNVVEEISFNYSQSFDEWCTDEYSSLTVLKVNSGKGDGVYETGAKIEIKAKETNHFAHDGRIITCLTMMVKR